MTSDDTVNALYVQIQPVNTKVSRTVQAIPGELHVDYDAAGQIIGAEFLGVPAPPGIRWIVTRALPEPSGGDPHWNSTQFFGPHKQEENPDVGAS